MSAMNILHVISSLNPTLGGPMQCLRNYLPEMAKRKCNNEVVCLDDPGESFIGKDDFTTHALGPGKRPWGYTKKLLPWLQTNLHRFDAVIVHGLWQYHSYGVYKAATLIKKRNQGRVPPVFVMPHGMLDPYFQKAPERKLKAIRNSIYWQLVEEKVTNTASALLFTCEEELQLARQTFRSYRPKKEINISFGITEPPPFSPEMEAAFSSLCRQYVDGSPFLLFLSRIHPKKGVDLLIKAYAQLKAERNQIKLDNATPHSFPLLLIVGPGMETVYGQQLKRLVEDLHLQNCVFFPGMLSGKAKWGAFYACDAFALSSHQENFGIAVAEALACGKPVLISNQINIWREIKSANAGIVAEDTLEGTVALLRQWITLSAEQRADMSSAARACYETHFAIGPAVQNMVKAVSKMIGQPSVYPS
jgi:glycosyltransferase involved in cell wall biosynthesis